MKRILAAAMLAAAAMAQATAANPLKAVVTAPAAATREASTGFEFGYIPDGVELATTMSQGNTAFAYIKLPAERTRLYDGCRITKVRVILGTFRSRPNFKINITKDCREEGYFEYQQEAEVKSAKDANHPESWEVVLDDPYTITGGEDIYIGYQVAVSSSSHAVVAAYDTSMDLYDVNDIIAYYSPSNGSYIVNPTGYANAIFVTIEGDNLPQNDIELRKGSLETYGYVGKEVKLNALITNTGATAVKGMKYEVQLASGGKTLEPVSGEIDIDFPSRQFGNLEMRIPVTEEMNGNVDVKFTLLPTGQDDPTPENNTWTGNFTVLVGQAQRVLLLEHFTTMVCVNCPAGHRAVEGAMSLIGEDRVVWVAHHAGYGDDMYTTDADQSYVWLYGGGSYAPGVMLDRTVLTGNSAVFFPADAQTVAAVAQQALDTPGIVNISASPEYDETTRTLSISLDASLVSSLIANRQVRANLFLMEDNLEGFQFDAVEDVIPEYTHNHVFRQAVTGTWGEEIELATDKPFSKTYTCQIPDDWKLQDLWACAFISYYNPDNPAACEVLNTVKIPLGLNSGITAVKDSKPMSVSVAGRKVSINGEGCTEIYTPGGQKAAMVAGSGSVALPAGLYILRNGETSKKLIIK